MALYEEIRGQAKLDSRRFGKSINCEVIHGDDLTLVRQSGAVGGGVNSYLFVEETGYDPTTNTVLAVTTDNLAEFRSVLESYKNSSTQVSSYAKKDLQLVNDIAEGYAYKNKSSIEINELKREKDDIALKILNIKTKQNILIKALRKMLLVVTVPPLNFHYGGQNPRFYRVQIESKDVGQHVIGTWVRKNYGSRNEQE